MVAANPTFDYEGSSSIPSTNVRDPFSYVPPAPQVQEKKPKKKNNIQSYFSSLHSSGSDSARASESQLAQTHPNLDEHWKKQYKELAYEYIAK